MSEEKQTSVAKDHVQISDQGREALASIMDLSQIINPPFDEERSQEFSGALEKASSLTDNFSEVLQSKDDFTRGLAVFRITMLANSLDGIREDKFVPGTPLISQEQRMQVFEVVKTILNPFLEEVENLEPDGKYIWEGIFSLLKFSESSQVQDEFVVNLQSAVDRNIEKLARKFESVDHAEIYEFIKSSQNLYFALSFCSPERKKMIIPIIEQRIRENSVVACYYINSEEETLSKAANAKVVESLDEYELDSLEIVRDWQESYKESQGKAIERNYRAILALEEEKPGISAQLNTLFNISNFGRYPHELLVRQVERMNLNVPFGVAMYAKDDHNGAYYQAGQRVDSLHDSLEDNYDIRIFEFGSQRQAVKIFNRIKRTWKDNKISFALFGAHGSKRSMFFGKDQGRITTADLQHPIFKSLRTLFENEATVVLDSCSTGKKPVVNLGFAITLSALGFNVQAAEGVFHGVKSFQAVLSSNGELTDILVTPNNQDEKIIRYKNGEVVNKE